MFSEAIADLTKAIDLDEELADAYFNRGKCAYLLGDTALAFLDF
jgi:tetratricopeptide (TPR) repeat protein